MSIPRSEVIEQIPGAGKVLKDNASRGGDIYLFVPEDGGGRFPIDHLWKNYGHLPKVQEVREALGV